MLVRFLVTLLAIVALSGVGHAEELYLCDGGRLVRVEPGTLEDLKRTDPCIARYFGLEVSAAAASPTTPTAAEPADAATPPTLKGSAAPDEAAGAAAGDEARIGGWQRIANLTTHRKAQGHAVPDRVSVPGEGYRSVNILNAETGSSSTYRHTR